MATSLPDWVIALSFFIVLVGNALGVMVTLNRLRLNYERRIEEQVEQVVSHMISAGRLPSSEAQQRIAESIESLDERMDHVDQVVVAISSVEAKLNNGILDELRLQRKLLERLIERVSRLEGRFNVN